MIVVYFTNNAIIGSSHTSKSEDASTPYTAPSDELNSIVTVSSSRLIAQKGRDRRIEKSVQIPTFLSHIVKTSPVSPVI